MVFSQLFDDMRGKNCELTPGLVRGVQFIELTLVQFGLPQQKLVLFPSHRGFSGQHFPFCVRYFTLNR